MWSCVRNTARARNCSSITLAKPCRSSTGELARSSKPGSSLPCLERRVTPSPRQPGLRNSPTGWAHTLAASPFSEVHRRFWCPTICVAASPRRIATSPTSTPATATWLSTMAWPYCSLAQTQGQSQGRSQRTDRRAVDPASLINAVIGTLNFRRLAFTRSVI